MAHIMGKHSPKLEIVILAAGKGTRMYSSLPKVLHEVGGQSLLGHVIKCAHDLGAGKIHIVYGHGGEMVPSQFPDEGVNWILQEPQLGTGHAVDQAMPQVDNDAVVLVLYGDVPLIQASTLQKLVTAADSGKLALLTAHFDDPGSYGRIVRDANARVARIVEKKDASKAELAITEINTGFLACPASHLQQCLAKLDNNNAQGEYYLTDIVGLTVEAGQEIVTAQPESRVEITGINSKVELAQMERAYQMKQAQTLMEQGVTLRDPARLDVRGTVKAGKDVVIDVNVILEGDVVIGDNVTIGPNCLIINSSIGNESLVLANCVIENSEIGKACSIGPFSRLRPETCLADKVKLGNFVEIKKSRVGEASKINHLSYVGDSEVGKNVNIGAGTITCNYDGANKHRTIIEDNVFIGSDTQLVAPVTVGEGATIGAGATITRDTPAGELTISRVPQKTIEGWQRPVKKKK